MLDEGAWVAAARRQSGGRPVVGVMGGGTAAAAVLSLATDLGRALGRAGWAVLTGGGGGVMEAASRGAHGTGVPVIGVLPVDRPRPPYPNAYVTAALFTGLGGFDPATGAVGRNRINVRAAHAVVALPGAAGTNSEIRLAAAAGRPLVLLGWTREDLEEATRRVLGAASTPLREAPDPSAAVGWLRPLLEGPRRREAQP